MPIPTENVGSLPRPATLQAAIAAYDAGTISREELERERALAVREQPAQYRRVVARELQSH